MTTQQKSDKILSIIRSIMDDDKKLTKVLEFLENEIPEESVADNNASQGENYLEQIPEKYRKAIKEIADNISANLISYFNPDTLEIDSYHKDAMMESFGDEDDEEDWVNPESKWDNCITVEPLRSHESFNIMERFVDQLNDKREAARLSQALSGSKPFANFNHIIHNSEFRQNWFDFQQTELEKYVLNNYFYNIDKE